MVTPLRDILKRTYLRLGSIVGHDPEAKTVEMRAKYGEVETLPYDQLLLALGSVSRTLPVPGLSEHAIGFKDLADAIWLRNHLVETLEEANATEDRRGATGSSPTSSSAAATPASRRSPSCRTLPPTRSRATRGPACTGCAGCWSRRPGGSCRIDTQPPTTRCGSCAAAASTSGWRRPWSRLAPTAPASPAATLPTCTVVWTAGVAPQPILRDLICRWTARPGAGRRATASARDSSQSGRWALRRRPEPRGGLCPPTAQHAVRQGPWWPATSPRSWTSARRSRSIPQRSLLRQPRPLQGGGPDRGPHLPRLPGLVAGADLPHEPDSRRRPQGPRGTGLDRGPALPTRHLRGRLDRSPEAAALAKLSSRSGLLGPKGRDAWT